MGRMQALRFRPFDAARYGRSGLFRRQTVPKGALKANFDAQHEWLPFARALGGEKCSAPL